MIEKVNPSHPDKVADRIAGAIVDLAYSMEKNPKIAVEVLIGHGVCYIVAESSVLIDTKQVESIVKRIAGNIKTNFVCVKQDEFLAKNQSEKTRYGKYILDNNRLIICQSNAKTEDLQKRYKKATINPLGDWTGGTDVDSGATKF